MIKKKKNEISIKYNEITWKIKSTLYKSAEEIRGRLEQYQCSINGIV